jgi:putative DNA primase/helicase
MNYTKQLNAALNFGLLVDLLECDGQIHRAATQLKPKGKNGWYIAFSESPTLVMGDWQIGITEIWKPDGYKQTNQERIYIQRAIKAAELTRTKDHAIATQQARDTYRHAKPVTEHQYLINKGINATSVIRCKDNLLIVPLVDYSLNKPELINIQTINAQGFKKFTKGGRVTGLCCPIEVPNDGVFKRLYIAEGLSTAVSVYQITGCPVLAAMNANNLIPVAKIARQRWPDIEIIITGDDDYLTERKTGSNPGKDKAINAASMIRAKTAFPPFTFEEKLAGLTDWNDYEQSLATKAVS